MLKNNDKEMYDAIELERKRQEDHIELIASENYVSKDVLEATGSILTNKYAEGYPKDRYYGGCEAVDVVENLTIERCKKLFGAKYANVQPHSGTQANMIVYMSLLKLNDTVLSFSPNDGGHVSHGGSDSFSGKDYNFIYYGLNDDERIDYDDVLKKALEYKPKLIVTGASSYPREIDFKRFREIADKVNAYLMVDMAHIAGLVASGLHQNPVFYADVVTSTTHKTLRGPRGGIILTNNEEIIKLVNKSLFPGTQGGPLMHVIAAKGVAFKEDASPSFSVYSRKVIENAKAMACEFINLGYHVQTGGTDNHLLIVDCYKGMKITGKEAEILLDKVNISLNKNGVYKDPLPHDITSGIRIGSPAITTRGFNKDDCIYVVRLIDEAFKNAKNNEKLDEIRNKVKELLKKYPLD